MAAGKSVTPDYDANADVTKNVEDWEWETARDETPTGVVFEAPGETFIGQYLERRTVAREPLADGTGGPFNLHVFTGRDGKPYALSDSFALDEAYEDGSLKSGQWVRITFIKEIKTKRGLNPMKDLKIDIRK